MLYRTSIIFVASVVLGCSSQSFSSVGNKLTDSGSNESGGASQGTGGRSSGGTPPRTGGRPGSGGTPANGGNGGNGGVVGTGSASGNAGSGTGGDGGSSSDSGIVTTDGSVTTSDGSTIACRDGVVKSFPTFDKGCSSDATCVLVRHTTDCCGGELAMAINHSEVARFDAAEAICDTQYPGCGCAAQGMFAEDGTMVPFGSENLIVTKCDNGKCTSVYSGPKFACGTTTCPDLDYCSATVSGVPGGGTSYRCVPLYGCTNCTCLSSSASCECTQAAVGITVTCYAP